MNFSIQNNQVMLNGVPGQIRSGAIHYFRTLPEQWEDRLVKLKRCGFNTVETYMASRFKRDSLHFETMTFRI